MKPTRFGIIVAGMHRSGTSAATGALQRLGVALGDQLMEGGDDNPKGYFEHEAVVTVHDRLLRELGSWWSDPRPLPDGWAAMPAARRAEDALVEIIRRDFGGAPLWAVKDPRACRLLPLWHRCMERLAVNSGVLHVVRAPADVAASLAARNGFSRSLSELLWLRHVTTAVRDSAEVPRTVLLYETLLKSPRRAMERALLDLGVTLPVGESTDRNSLEEFVDPGLSHHAKVATPPCNEMERLAAGVFAEFHKLASGEGDWQVLQTLCERFDADWSKMQPLVGSVAESVFPAIDGLIATQTELHEVRSALNAQIRWSEEAVVRHGALSEDRDVLDGQLKDALQALQAATARQSRLESELAAQVRWAEEAVVEHRAMAERREALALEREDLLTRQQQTTQDLALAKAEISRAQSELAAQVRWAEQAVIEHRATVEHRDALVGEREQLVQKLAGSAQTLAVAQAELATCHSEIAMKAARCESLSEELSIIAGQCDALRLANAGLQVSRDEARAELATLRDELAVRNEAYGRIDSQYTRLMFEQETLRAELERVADELSRLKGSRSWRWTAPLRRLSP